MFVLEACVSGIVGTLTLDLWQRVLRATAGIPVANWALVGRWFAHVPRGRILHDPITDAEPVANELAIGWIGHYLVGIGFGLIFVLLMRIGMGVEPGIVNGLWYGAATSLVPWLFFMPAMGNGLFGRKTPAPLRASFLAFVAHTIFGGGLGLGALLARHM